MKISINGQIQDVPPGEKLAALIARLCKTPDHVIAELNGAIVDRSTWPSTSFQENDRLELVTFVGGG